MLKPTMLILSPRVVANRNLLDIILNKVNDMESASEYPFSIIKSSEWNADLAVELLCNKVSLRGEDPEISFQSKYLRICSALDISEKSICSAVAGLLSYLLGRENSSDKTKTGVGFAWLDQVRPVICEIKCYN
jgi:hypothetical protein